MQKKRTVSDGPNNPMTPISVEAQLVWKVGQDKKSKFFIGICQELGITLQAETLGELAETIDDSLNALFTDLIQSNELDMFLQKRGWKITNPIPVRRNNLRFNVPFTIDRRPMHDCAGAVC